MKKQDYAPVPVIGGASLLVIFAVLCLCVLSLLTLHTALAEKRMADASMELAEAYYEADLQAQVMFARLRNGEQVPGVKRAGDLFSFSCEVSENQQLQVQLQKNGDSWMVLCWQTVAEACDDTNVLPVWDGK